MIAIEAFRVAIPRSYSSAIAPTVRLFHANSHRFLPNRTHLLEHGGQGSNRLLELLQFQFYGVLFVLEEYDGGMRGYPSGRRSASVYPRACSRVPMQ